MVRRRQAEEQAGCAGAYLEGEGCRAGRRQLPCTGLVLVLYWPSFGGVESHETIRAPQLTPDSPPLFLCFWGGLPGLSRRPEIRRRCYRRSGRSPCRRGRWGSAQGVRSKPLVRVECRFGAPVVKSFESPVGQRGTRTMIMGHGGGGGAPVRIMELHPSALKGIHIPLMGPPASTCLLTSLPLTYRPTTGPLQAHRSPSPQKYRLILRRRPPPANGTWPATPPARPICG